MTSDLSIGGAVLAANDSDNTSSVIKLEEFTEIESAVCTEEIDDTTEDTGCGSKYFPSE